MIARLNVGGPARHVVWLTVGLREHGYDTTLVTGPVPPEEGDMGYFATAHGVTPVVLPDMSREISVKDLVNVWKLYRHFTRIRPAIVHTHTAKGGAVGRLAGLLYRWLTPSTLWGKPRRCRFVHTFHGHVFHSYFAPWKTRFFLTIERLLAWLTTDRIVVISPQQFREIHEHYGVGRAEQFRVIPLGLDVGAFADWRSRRGRLRQEWQADDGEVLVGIVGRLTDIKNHAMFLEAAAHYRANAPAGVPRVRFVIIGDGHLRTGLEQKARQLGLGSAVLFAGQRDDPEYFYPALDIVALTSLNEGTPLTLLEAMANARPVLATAVGGVVDLLGEAQGSDASLRERGILTARSDVPAFADALARLITDAPLRQQLGERGQEWVIQHYSRERLVDDMARLYEELSGTSKTPAPGGSRQAALTDSTL